MNTNNYLKVRQGSHSVEFFFDRYNDLSKASARNAANTLAKELRRAEINVPVEISIYRHCKDGFAFLPCIGGALVGCEKCAPAKLRLVPAG